MKKFGFTLSELVVTLAIVGVAAALIAPNLSNLVPDKHKPKVLRYNAVLNNAVISIMNKKGYFQTVFENNLPDNYIQNLRNDLAQELKLDPQFRYSDGSRWNIVDLTDQGGEIIIDTEPSVTKGQYGMDRDRLSDIDTFIFRIDDAGNVSAGDPLTAAYLLNPTKLNDSKRDLATAQNKLIDFED